MLLKQFGLVAIPFLVVLALLEGSRRDARRLLVACGATIAVGALPFLVAGPSALWDDTIAYGTGTYRIIGYGLAALLERAGIVHGRTGSYPFDILALVVWLPATAWAVRARRSAAASRGRAPRASRARSSCSSSSRGCSSRRTWSTRSRPGSAACSSPLRRAQRGVNA